MKKYLLSILLIGLAWGKAEPDTSEIDYYQMGIDAANDDFNSMSYYFVGCTVYGLCLIPVVAIAPVKIPEKYNSVLFSDGGESFKISYKKELKKLKVKIIGKGTFHLISAAGVSYALFIVFLKAGGINLFYK